MLRGRGAVGQGIVEYGLVLFLTVSLTGLILLFFGGTLAEILAWIGGAIDSFEGGT